MAKKLTYFDMPTLGEGIRYILHYTGQKFQDERIPLSSWPDKQIKESLPFGQLPVYEEGKRSLHQSLAIARYLATNTPLLPTDPWDQAAVDAAVFTIYDYHKHVVTTFLEKDPVKKEALLKTLFDETLDFFFSRFEQQIKENNGFLYKKLSWADLIFVAIVETSNLVFKQNFEKNYPAIAELMKKVNNLPGIKEYVKTRKPYVFKENE